VAREHLHKLTGGVGPTPPAPRGDDRPGAGGSQSEVDAAWAKIVAGFHHPVDSPSWPAAEGVDATRAPAPGPDPTADPTAAPDPEQPRRPGPTLPSAADFSGITLNRRRTDPQPPPDPSLLDGLDTFGAGLADDDEDRYVPPPPPPLPRISKYAVAGVLGIVVGFILLLRPTLLPLDRDLVTMVGFTSIVVGAVTLVWRLRSGDDDEDFDDGAVV
jgi:hypothetical protein